MPIKAISEGSRGLVSFEDEDGNRGTSEMGEPFVFPIGFVGSVRCIFRGSFMDSEVSFGRHIESYKEGGVIGTRKLKSGESIIVPDWGSFCGT